jgi:hypothetical protein
MDLIAGTLNSLTSGKYDFLTSDELYDLFMAKRYSYEF